MWQALSANVCVESFGEAPFLNGSCAAASAGRHLGKADSAQFKDSKFST